MISGNRKVCVIGIWHLGSVVSACLADSGYSVVGVDEDARRVADLNSGTAPLFEPGLNELIADNIRLNRLAYTTDLGQALQEAEYVLVTFDCPVDDNDEVDVSEVYAACAELARYLENGSIVIVSSQVPVGTCDQLKSQIAQSNPSLDFDIACSPENLRLGEAIDCFKNPERIVIGADSNSTLDRVEAFFDVVAAPKLRVSLRTAEMTKHALNALLATSISFANEIANLCDEAGADALAIAAALHSDARIGPKLPLLPGLGFAGGTLARDLKILKKLGESHGSETPLIDGVLRVNERQNGVVVRKLHKTFASLEDLTVGILGLTYKPGTSTLRRSAALEIIKDLTSEGAAVKAYDPKADPVEIQQHKEFEFCSDPYTLAEGADALVLVTEWPEFKSLDYDLLKSRMRRPVFIDTKNMLDDKLMIEKGFLYLGIGRGAR